jgi:hypothetical protein
MDWNWLWDASEFMTRNHCGPGWTPELIGLYIVSNAMIALAYFAISIVLYFLYRKDWEDPPTTRMFAMFMSFIFLCGLTHVSDAAAFYWVPYRLYTFLYMLTAISSAVAALNLPFLVARLVRYPSPAFVNKLNDQLREEMQRRAEAEKELTRRNEILKGRVSILEEVLKDNAIKTLEDLQRTNQWIHERNVAMEELRKLLSEWETP